MLAQPRRMPGLGVTMRQVRRVSLLLLVFCGALSGRAFSLNWQNGLSAAGASMSDTANALMQQELQQQLLEQQHQQRMQEIQAQHDLQMQQLQEQQRAAAVAESNAIYAAQMAHLVKTFPRWRTIVGQVDIRKQAPDPKNPFRKWLATKDAAYQAMLYSTNSPREIEEAIVLFRAESQRRRR